MGKRLWMGILAVGLVCTGCQRENSVPLSEQYLALYAQMEGATMEVETITHGENLVGAFTLQCEYFTQADTTLTVLAPEEMMGVTATIAQGDLTLMYDGVCFNMGTLSQSAISPVSGCFLLLQALQSGWLLWENQETYQGQDCLCLGLDMTGETAYLATVWLGLDDGLIRGGEIFVNDTLILELLFTNFSFCDTIKSK